MRYLDPQFRKGFRPEILEAIIECGDRHGAMLALAHRLNWPVRDLWEKRKVIRREIDMRAACGAFLPDNGLPYCVVMRRLLKSPHV